MKMAYESLFICKKCHGNLVIPKRIVVKKLTVIVLAACSHCNKQVKFTLPLPQVHDWIDNLAENFFRCPKCGVTGVVTRTIQSGDFNKLRLYCSSCQKPYSKVTNASIYDYLMASHVNRVKSRGVQQAIPAYYVPMGQVPPAPPAQLAPAEPPTAPAKPLAPSAPPAPSAPKAPPFVPQTVKECSNCKSPLTPDALFCRKCGVPVEPGTEQAPRCPYCGATLSPKAQMCPKCSSKVRCDKCDALLSANARFCVKCGEPLKREAEYIEEPKLTCHFCGGALELEDKICPECGKPVKCPNCGNQLKSGVRFCNKCGSNVSEITMTSREPSITEEEEEEFDENLEDETQTPAVMIKCPECGAKMSEIYTFCTICGTKLEK